MTTCPRSLPGRLAMLAAAAMLAGAAAAAPPVVDEWRYTTEEPADGWTAADFDDSAWQTGTGGFGTPDTPGSRVGTAWEGPAIWLRKTLVLDAVPADPRLYIHHDEDAAVYLNGTRVAKLDGYVTRYELVPIEGEPLKTGENVMAVRCRQTGGGQFIDAHLVDGAAAPKLPKTRAQVYPVETPLASRWARDVTADNAWTEYPRPQMTRPDWRCLNGRWQYAITPIGQIDAPTEWDGELLVPFALESKLGGVQRLLDDDEALWYRRTVEGRPADGLRRLLNFEAVDYRSEVFVNGQGAATHAGGSDAFSVDVTDLLQDGENEVVVRVEDATGDYQPRGKQSRQPAHIWYTRVSGIWQTVWAEDVPAARIEDLTIGSSAEDGTITVRTDTVGGEGLGVRVVVSDGGEEVARGEGRGGLTVAVPEAKLWSPESPHLYDLEVSLIDGGGREVDRVGSYAGIRTVGKTRDAAGHLRFTLNGEPVFHWGPLDQGWWPAGLLTPPSDEAIRWEVEWLKAAGFNMIRKHIKVEPRRYYAHCDRVGMLVWQDQPSATPNPPWTRMRPDPTDREWPDAAHEQFLAELEAMVDQLESHPSIVVWVPFNEAWGQHRTVAVGQWLAERDPSRLVNAASGGNFWPVGDVADEHAYPAPAFPLEGQGERFADFIKVVGEFGGHGYPVEGHLWNPAARNWGYGGLPKTEAEYRQRYAETLRQLDELRAHGIAAGVYTQTTDVEGEINGLMTYDREAIKIPAEELAEMHRRLFED